jgi:hypothetical protein
MLEHFNYIVLESDSFYSNTVTVIIHQGSYSLN